MAVKSPRAVVRGYRDGRRRGIVKGVARASAKTNLPEHWTKGGMEMEARVGDQMLFRDVWERRSQELDCWDKLYRAVTADAIIVAARES